MFKKITIKSLVAMLGVLLLSSIVVGTLVYHQDYVPANPGLSTSRFWNDETFFRTTSDVDTLASNGSITSRDIVMTKDIFSDVFGITGKETMSICSEFYFIGDIDITNMDDDSSMADSLTLAYYYTDASGEDIQIGSVVGLIDTLILDTLGLGVATAAGVGLPFIFKLGATIPNNEITTDPAFIGAVMRFKLTIIDAASLPVADTLLIDNCAILRRWTN